MSLQTLAFNDYVTKVQNALASGSVKFTNFRVGSAAYALSQAIAGNSLSLQGLVSQVFDATRLGTSEKADVDSFLADYGLSRVGAVGSSGVVAFNRNNTTVPVTIPASPIGTVGGAIVQTQYSGIQFQVIPDNNNPAYNPIVGGYVMGNGVATVNVTVQALVPGSGSNVLANTITQLVSGTLGINTVNNANGFTNGADAETDTQAKGRFLDFISSLSRATTGSVSAAVKGVQPNLTFQIIEGKDFDGSTYTAGFIIIVDDGTGAISVALQNQVLTAVNGVRAAGITCKVYPPSVVTLNVAAHLIYGAGYNPNVVQANVTAAVTAVLNGYGVGGGTNIGDVEAAIQNTPGVQAYSGVTLNGGTASIAILQTQLARMGTMTFS